MTCLMRVVDVRTHLDSLRESDVPEAARLHRRAFPRFFLSSLGEPFLSQFYRGFLGDDTAIAVVARDDDGAVRGVVVGTVRPAGFFSRLLRRQWRGFLAASIRAAISNPAAIPRLLRAVRYRGQAGADPDGALLSSICVDPGLQGGGVGAQLISEWTACARRLGADRAYLSTDAEENEAVNTFYRAQGWQLAERFITPQGRHMNRFQIRLGD